jgi:hypothetical protein
MAMEEETEEGICQLDRTHGTISWSQPVEESKLFLKLSVSSHIGLAKCTKERWFFLF